jgi:hypothetical protein
MPSIISTRRLQPIGTTVFIMSLVRTDHVCFCANIRRVNLVTGKVDDT